MKLLLIHSDYIEYEAKKETPVAEDDIEPSGRLEEALTAFVAVESGDAEDVDSVIEGGVEEIRDVADELSVENVMLYPYAHLSQDLASPDTAVSVLKSMETDLSEQYVVKRAPFGWYKAFQISCKGHPLSELSRVVEPKEVEPEGEDEEEDEEVTSEYLVLTPDGDEVPAREYLDDATRDFRRLVLDELGELEVSGGEPPHIDIMREKEFVGYDDLSDPGNFRWYPRGKLVRDSIIDYVNDLVVDYGGMPVETPIMYDLGSQCIHEHSDKFGERQYRFESGDREMMLRFAACFGQFSIMQDMHIAENDLPLRIYEMSKYSFRREQRGELSGLKRLRAFTMPDMHTACRDVEEAKDEFLNQAVLGHQTGDDFDLDYVAVLRATEEFYDDNRDWVDTVVEDIDEPVLVELISERKHYWTVKIDFAAIDSEGRPMENPTVQIDVESAERFDISYYGDDGGERPILLHYSPSGSIERAFAAILERASREDTPSLPTWMSPTHVRLIPVSDDHMEFCDELADELEEDGVRVDIDDRAESVGKKISSAERDWVPYAAVIGDREAGGDPLSVRVRGEGEEIDMSVDELKERVGEDVGDKPDRELYLPRRLSRHPQFE
ncbi:MAG: threonine--tRNA ligase [Halobacteria archaeon]